jgi:hypothetical protein
MQSLKGKMLPVSDSGNEKIEFPVVPKLRLPGMKFEI